MAVGPVLITSMATELETILDSDSDDDTVTASDTDDESKPKTVIAGPQLVVPSPIDYDLYVISFFMSPLGRSRRHLKTRPSSRPT